jgi:hypothetical protein
MGRAGPFYAVLTSVATLYKFACSTIPPLNNYGGPLSNATPALANIRVFSE